MEQVIRDIASALRANGGQPLNNKELTRLLNAHNKRVGGATRAFSKKNLMPFCLRLQSENPSKWAELLEPAAGTTVLDEPGEKVDGVLAADCTTAPSATQLERALLDTLKVKPRRTASGVATITVITKPWTCSSNCRYCPNDIRMPKSYLADEPACQRAERNCFDPYLQVTRRLRTLHQMGHITSKVEVIVLGGTWSDYPESYQLWFVTELFRALNDGVGEAAAIREAHLRERYAQAGIQHDKDTIIAQCAELQQSVNAGEATYNQAARKLYGIGGEPGRSGEEPGCVGGEPGRDGEESSRVDGEPSRASFDAAERSSLDAIVRFGLDEAEHSDSDAVEHSSLDEIERAGFDEVARFSLDAAEHYGFDAAERSGLNADGYADLDSGGRAAASGEGRSPNIVPPPSTPANAWRAASAWQTAQASELFAAQQENETAEHRMVGLVVETRPDLITPESLTLLRRLGCTKVQMGIQSLDPEILRANQRRIDVRTIEEALELARLFGFKTHTHFMVNLLGATPESDKLEYRRFMTEPAFQPDEVKLYPCALIGGTALESDFAAGRWQPYAEDELLDVLVADTLATPPFCRISRMIRDFSAGDIVAGNKKINLRQLVERRLEQENAPVQEIRYREIATGQVDVNELHLDVVPYATAATREFFLQWITPDNQIAGFLRLSLPEPERLASWVARGASLPIGPQEAMIREVHVYGKTAQFHAGSQSAQHAGLGRQLVDKAAEIARAEGFAKLNVISAVGTRGYYRSLGFADNGLYQQLDLERSI